MVPEKWIDEFEEPHKENNPYYERKRRLNSPGMIIQRNRFLVIGGLAVLLLIVIVLANLMGGEEPAPETGIKEVSQKLELLESRLNSLEKEQEALKQQQTKLQSPENLNPLAQKLETLRGEFEDFKKENARAYEALKKKVADKPKQTSASRDSGQQSSSDTGSRYHVVQKGENLFRISQKYNVEIEALRRWNNLGPDDPIYPGQKLVVQPGGGR